MYDELTWTNVLSVLTMKWSCVKSPACSYLISFDDVLYTNTANSSDVRIWSLFIKLTSANRLYGDWNVSCDWTCDADIIEPSGNVSPDDVQLIKSSRLSPSGKPGI